MAQSPENQSNTPSQSSPAVSAGAEKTSAASRTVGATAEGEKRTFAEGLQTARNTGSNAADAARETVTNSARAARDIAASAADTSRRLVESGRQTRHEVADLWRASLDPLPALQLELTRLFDTFWSGALGVGGGSSLRAARPFASLGTASLFGQPPADIRETETAYLLAIEAPGLDAEDLDLSLEGESLVVRGHKAEEREDATATYRISERRFGRFERRFPVAADVDRQNIEAQYRDGVLKITLPRHSQGEHPRARIEIQREQGAHREGQSQHAGAQRSEGQGQRNSGAQEDASRQA